MAAPAKDSILVKYIYPVSGVITGMGSVAISNHYLRRPLYAGVQRHILFGLLGGITACYVESLLNRKWSERDAIVKHYIELHPEDFTKERRKYKEIFDEWYPIR